MSLPVFKLLRPRNIQEAVGHLARHRGDIMILAGGTDLLPSMRQKLFTPGHVMDIRGIEELHGIRVTPGLGVEIGAMTQLSAIEDSEFIRRNYRVLHEAVMTVASPILRNMGTLGGNICLDTRCVWYNQSLQFYTNIGDAHMRLDPNEMLTRVYLPESSAGWKGSYLKLRVRGSIDYPMAGVAVALKKKDGAASEMGRVAITAVNPAPLLVKGAEHALTGKQIDEHVATVVGELAARMSKPLTTSALTPEYRREMVKVFTKRAVLAAAKS